MCIMNNCRRSCPDDEPFCSHHRDKKIDWQARAEAAETSLKARNEEVADLKSSVIAFCAPWAVTYARDMGLPEGHLHPTHYDILAACGGRMTDFTRSSLSHQGGKA
jgi:hypothetical protein